MNGSRSSNSEPQYRIVGWRDGLVLGGQNDLRYEETEMLRASVRTTTAHSPMLFFKAVDEARAS
jgi:hypothetical protein